MNKFALLVIAFALCSVQYHNIKRAILSGPHLEYKVTNFLYPQKGLSELNKVQRYYWKGRVVSCIVASKVCEIFGSNVYDLESSEREFRKTRSKPSEMQYRKNLFRFASVSSGFGASILFLTFIAIIWLSSAPLIFILGISAAIQYSWLPAAESLYLPWDPFALFAWTLILLINTTKYKKWILLLIPALSLFKETTIVLSILILFWTDEDLKVRIKKFLAVGFICVVIKIILSKIGGSEAGLWNQSFHYETRCRTGEYWIIHRNWNFLWKWLDFNPIILSAAGLPIATLFLPKSELQYKIITLAYLGIIFIPCVLTEARLFNELIPVFFIGLESCKFRSTLV